MEAVETTGAGLRRQKPAALGAGAAVAVVVVALLVADRAPTETSRAEDVEPRTAEHRARGGRARPITQLFRQPRHVR